MQLSGEEIYNLVLSETGSKEAAEEAERRYLADLLRSGKTPE